MENKNPLSPHIQIYRWHISSLVSISHRVTGIINIVAITLICIWASLLVFGEANYVMINFVLNSFLGKFIAPLVMSIVYFAVVFPTYVFLSIIKKNYLNIKYERNKKTYWINVVNKRTSMKDQF